MGIDDEEILTEDERSLVYTFVESMGIKLECVKSLKLTDEQYENRDGILDLLDGEALIRGLKDVSGTYINLIDFGDQNHLAVVIIPFVNKEIVHEKTAIINLLARFSPSTEEATGTETDIQTE